MEDLLWNRCFPNRPKQENVLFTFSPFRITRVESSGNKTKGIACPKPRSGHRIVVLDGDIYSFGGYNPDTSEDQEFAAEDVLLKEVWKFNYATKTWIFLDICGFMAEEVVSHCAVLVDQYMLIYGGTSYPFGQKCSNRTHLCDLKTLEWYSPETNGDLPEEMYGQAITISENKMYVIGGTTGYDYSISVHCLNFSNRKWEDLTANSKREPEARYRHEVALYKNKIFILGGGTSMECFDLKRIPVFDIETRSWSYSTTSDVCPEPRRCHGSAQMGSDIYICGGLNASNIFSDIWKLNLETLVWTNLTITLPTPLYFHAVSLSQAGQMFIFGGVAWANSRINDVYAVWLNIPSLADMCWEAFLHYVPDISSQKKAKLFEAGIPIRYLNTIEFDEPLHDNLVLR